MASRRKLSRRRRPRRGPTDWEVVSATPPWATSERRLVRQLDLSPAAVASASMAIRLLTPAAKNLALQIVDKAKNRRMSKRTKKQKSRKSGKRRYRKISTPRRRPSRRIPYYSTPARTYARYGTSPAEHSRRRTRPRRGFFSHHGRGRSEL